MASFISMRKDTESSAAILPRIAQADKSAVQECVELYGSMIWALAKQFTDSPSEAEKIVPQIFTDIWQNAEFCDLEISEEAVWAAFIARRRLSQDKMKNNLSSQSAKINSPDNFAGSLRPTPIIH